MNVSKRLRKIQQELTAINIKYPDQGTGRDIEQLILELEFGMTFQVIDKFAKDLNQIRSKEYKALRKARVEYIKYLKKDPSYVNYLHFLANS